MGKGLDGCIPKGSWFNKWMSVWPLAESPKTFILTAGMAMMGAALGRRVWFGQDFRALWPMLNVLLIGPSGIGKTSSIMMARPLLGTIPKIDQPQFIMGGTTPEALHDALLPNPHAVLFASELANFFNKADYNSALIPYVTELLDYEPVERNTKSGGKVRIEEPSVAVVGASTREWLQEQLPDSAVSGGFLARFFILAEEHKSQRVASPEDAISQKDLRELHAERDGVFAEFYPCVNNYYGQIRFADYGALDAYTVWYSSHNPINGHLAPFAARAPEFIKRFALIFAVSKRKSVIDEEDVQCAINLYGVAEKKLQEIVVPMTAQGKMLNLVLQAVGHQALTDVELKQHMRNFCASQEVDKLIASLIASRDVLYIDGKFVRS